MNVFLTPVPATRKTRRLVGIIGGLMLGVLVGAACLRAQIIDTENLYETPYKGRPRYPEGLLSLRALAGATKYSGEFTDHTVGKIFNVGAQYSVVPEVLLGLVAEWGNGVFTRRERRITKAAYEYQFGEVNNVKRSVNFGTYFFEMGLNFFPREYLTGHLTVGIGATFYSVEDYRLGQVTVRPNNDDLATVCIPVGLGADWFLNRKIAITGEFKHHFLFSDKFDAFPSADIRSEARSKFGINLEDEDPVEGNDAYWSLAIGIKVFVFEDSDIDGDLILNIDEEKLGTNPYDPDTDEDGLTDYEEVKTFSSNPLLLDTDGDGLNDFLEVMKYRTDVNKVDTDLDNLPDGDEVFIYRTNPLNPDTDGEGLTDDVELKHMTDPNVYDTDKDGLSDFAEVITYDTNPLVEDTDGEGLKDFEEVLTYNTKPRVADTDGDGLTDFEEVSRYQTNPLVVDTDGDSLSDFEELRRIGTDPLKKDSDDDSYADNLDTCPLLAEVYNGFQDDDGCPDVSPKVAITPSLTGKQQINKRDTTIYNAPITIGGSAFPSAGQQGYINLKHMDTLEIREGAIITLYGVNFEVDKDVIRVESMPILEENAKLFTLYPEMEVEIRGHTDSDASEDHNSDLSERRAIAVRRFLVNHGIDESRMTAFGFGESMPIAPNTDPIGKAKNRRTEFFIKKLGPRNELYWKQFPSDSTRQIMTPGSMKFKNGKSEMQAN